MASEPATLDSISLVDMASSIGEDYLLIDLPSEADAVQADEPTLDDVDVNVTKADLDAELMEPQRVMQNMGLEKKPASVAEAKGSEPLAGFVSASKPEPEDTIKSLDIELFNLNMDKETGWETVITPLPEQAARFARVLTHGELRSLLSAFKESSWTPPLMGKILEVYVIAKRSAAHTEMLKAKHTSQRGGSVENLTEKDRGPSHPWFVLIAFTLGLLCDMYACFASAPHPLTCLLPPCPSLRWMDKRGS